MKKPTLILLSLLLCCMPAFAGAVEDALSHFDDNPSPATANAFFARLLEEDFLDEPMSYAAGSPVQELKANVWYWAGEWFYDMQAYASAIAYGQKSLPEFPEDDDESRADCLNLLAISYFRMSDFQKAAEYAMQCFALDEKSGDPDRISSSLNTIAGIYVGANQPAEAEKYILRALEYASKVDNPARLAVLQGTASEVFHAEGKDTEALRYADDAYNTEMALGREYNAKVRLAQKASVLVGLNRWKEAEALLEEIIPYFKGVRDAHSLGIADNKMGMTQMALEHFAEAIPYYREAAEIFSALQDPYNEIQARRGLYESLWRTGDPKAASAEFYRFNDLKDSIYKVTTAESLARYDAEYGNDWLRLENHAERQARVRAVLIGVGVALLLSLLALGIWCVMRRRSRTQAEINASLSQDIRELREKYNQLHIHYDNILQTREPAGGREYELAPADREFVEQAVTVVNDLIANGSVDAATAAERLRLSPYLLRQRLSTLLGETPQSFIQTVRMRRACFLLDNHPELNVTEVSELCAYSDVASFTRSFKKTFGKTPTRYAARK